MVKYQGRCMKCKKQREILKAKAKRMKNKLWAVTGPCKVCNTTIYRIIGKEKPKV